MNLLLDTHTYIWFYNDRPELSPTVRQMIESEDMQLLSADTIFDSYGSLRVW